MVALGERNTDRDGGRFVIQDQEAQPIADQIKFWILDRETGKLETVFISFYDAADANEAAEMALTRAASRGAKPADQGW